MLAYREFCFCDLDLYESDLDILKTYICTKNEVTMSKLSEVTAHTDTHTNTQTDMTKCITTTAFAGGNKTSATFSGGH